MLLFGSNARRQTWVFITQYTGVMLALNLIWEIAHLPLYTLWDNPDFASKAFAIIHCTLGDGLIAVITFVIARLAIGGDDWPQGRYWRVAATTLLLGLIYTIFSEWLNVSLRQSWDYQEAMPTLPPIGTGLSPLLQWIVLPLVSFAILKTVGDRARTNP